jgi:uncharacterized protein YjlB
MRFFCQGFMAIPAGPGASVGIHYSIDIQIVGAKSTGMNVAAKREFGGTGNRMQCFLAKIGENRI